MKNFLLCIFLFLFIGLSHSQAQVLTRPDSTLIFPGETHLISVLNNDSALTAGGMEVVYAYSYNDIPTHTIPVVNNTQVRVTRNKYLATIDFMGASSHRDTIAYVVKHLITNSLDTGLLIVDFRNLSFAELNVNNLDARFSATGNHFWDLSGQSKFFAPKGSLKTSIFCQTLWMAGLFNGNVHLAAERFRQVGEDFWAGPVSNGYDSLFDRKWNRIWKIEEWQIIYHQANYSNPNYTIFKDIAEWPAHGDTTLGESWNIAPFVDVNLNGIYEPMLGDYPQIRGDMALFFVFNDDRRPHTETGGTPFKLQVNAMAFAYNCPSDPMMSNTLFLHYDLVNRSTHLYEDVFVGSFTDIDLGYGNDDYIGCDVANGAYYGYNGVAFDGAGQTWAYGANPPYMGVQLLAGPLMDPDFVDNPALDSLSNPLCGLNINGAFFGNGIVDDERLGMTRFIYFNNSSSGIPNYLTDPNTTHKYFMLMNGYWTDSTAMMYGGNGHMSYGAYGPACRFMFPGTSDSCNWGTGGLAPNGPVNWTESTAGNTPSDRRGLAVSGPFTFAPGQSQPFDLAFAFAYDTVHNANADTLSVWFAELKRLFQLDSLDCGYSTAVGLQDPQQQEPIKAYPNPANDRIWIQGINSTEDHSYRLFSLAGQLLKADNYDPASGIDTGTLRPGIYILRLQSKQGSSSLKFIKM